ncbi:oxidoreductase [Nannocystis punicea]|uniref:Oxidoreductase n=1 Tax=Nannocystis punicea TaxID=2995304 RepID=A0ABY7H7E3_9BACT|nr:oxidoreductase [Nannocystis poenicansa]WAS91286.1 oxidoreductase [Nannocystis poenicansa]WAS94914.1 oxidoreductase [Nannocystis poenicansa]
MAKVWFITGASRGLGLEIAEAALAAGDIVVAAVRDPERAAAAMAEHPRRMFVKLDVRDEAQAQAAAAAAVERFGRIDVLVNNAGYGLLGAVEEGAADEVEALFRTNVFGLLAVTRAVLPHMRRQRSGHVLNMSSLGGYASGQGWGLYCATKFAVEGITEALAQELAPLGVHATVIEPGFFRTEFLAGGSLGRVKREIADYAATVGTVREFADGHDGEQPGDPKQLAQVMLKVVAAEQPPVRVPVGADAFARVESKNAAVAAELAQWREVAAVRGFAG